MNHHEQRGTPLYPSTSYADEISFALRALTCMRHSGPTIYVAAPITGGPRFVEWFGTQGKELTADQERFAASLRNSVIEPNSRRAAAVIQDLQCRNDAVYVDPSMLSMELWSQNDYRHFWCRVIEAFAEQAIFLDGWHLSSGCAFEFLVCAVKRIPVYAQTGEPLAANDGFQLMESGFSVLTNIGADTSFFQSVLIQMRDLMRGGVE